jgi:Uma2 family endonuclease
MAIAPADLHRFTVDEFERMSEVGVLPERGVELVDGLVIEMSPRGDRHAYAVSVLNELFVDQRRGRYAVNPENLTLKLSLEDAREPDVVLARKTRSYARERPRPEDIALLVEVADSSLAYDLGEKKKAYARSGIPEYWIVDIPHEAVHVFRGANRFAEAYLTEQRHAAHATIAPAEFADVAIPVAQILGLDDV